MAKEMENSMLGETPFGIYKGNDGKNHMIALRSRIKLVLYIRSDNQHLRMEKKLEYGPVKKLPENITIIGWWSEPINFPLYTDTSLLFE